MVYFCQFCGQNNFKLKRISIKLGNIDGLMLIIFVSLVQNAIEKAAMPFGFDILAYEFVYSLLFF